MSAPSKRFKVVRDAHGIWGILDTSEEHRNLFGRGGFAPFAFSDFTSHRWLDLVVDHAIKLNKGEIFPPELHWVEYEPRKS